LPSGSTRKEEKGLLMSQTSKLNILAAVQENSVDRYQKGLQKETQFAVSIATSFEDARKAIADPTQQIDVFVIDNSLGDTFELVKEIRHTYPRLIIILVDEEADFALPGRADDISTTPFENNDLVTRIKRLNEDRRLQTLRADVLPPVRSFAKSILGAGTKGQSRQQAAVEAVKELGYDYVAYYSVSRAEPPELLLVAQVGPDDIMKIALHHPEYENTLLGWVAQNGQSRTVSPTDEPNHPFVKRGEFQNAACVPVGTTLRFGVLLACRKAADSITGENVMMLELVSAQLASALAKEQRD
jgi:DNA-binding response OmpR family regulator